MKMSLNGIMYLLKSGTVTLGLHFLSMLEPGLSWVSPLCVAGHYWDEHGGSFSPYVYLLYKFHSALCTIIFVISYDPSVGLIFLPLLHKDERQMAQINCLWSQMDEAEPGLILWRVLNANTISQYVSPCLSESPYCLVLLLPAQKKEHVRASPIGASLK